MILFYLYVVLCVSFMPVTIELAKMYHSDLGRMTSLHIGYAVVMIAIVFISFPFIFAYYQTKSVLRGRK